MFKIIIKNNLREDYAPVREETFIVGGRKMKKMMKRLTCALLALVMVLGLAACGDKGVKVPKEYEGYVSPWEMNVVEAAKADGKMHYYFMSAEGYMVNPTGSSSTKWGDGCLIVFPDGTTMLIDAGLAGNAPILTVNLQRMGIEKLDYFVLSHPHDDHGYGAVKEGGILYNFPVGQVYYNGAYNGDWSNPQILVELCQQKGYPCDILKRGDKLTIGEVSIEVLGPNPEVIGTTIVDNVTEVNNSSLVMRFDYGEHSSLFTGDVYKTAERELVKYDKAKLDVDLLKMPHHGGDTSSDSTFIYAVTAELGVATGWDPVDVAVFGRYKGTKTTVLMDTEDGYIHVSSGKDGVMTYETSRERSEKSTFGQLNKG